MTHIYLRAEQVKNRAFEHLDAIAEIRHIAMSRMIKKSLKSNLGSRNVRSWRRMDTRPMGIIASASRMIVLLESIGI